MPNHNWDCRPLLLRERQELRRQITTDIAVEGHKIRYPEGVENLEQQQRVFGRLSQGFRLLDQQMCLLGSRFGLKRRVAFDVHQSVRKRYLKLDLLATPRRRAGQGRDLLEGPGELGRGFGERRACLRLPTRLSPEGRGLLDQPGLGAVTRQVLRLALDNLGELAFEGFGDAGVKRAARLTQQRAI